MFTDPPLYLGLTQLYSAYIFFPPVPLGSISVLSHQCQYLTSYLGFSILYQTCIFITHHPCMLQVQLFRFPEFSHPDHFTYAVQIFETPYSKSSVLWKSYFAVCCFIQQSRIQTHFPSKFFIAAFHLSRTHKHSVSVIYMI